MPMFGQGGQLPPWLQQQEDPTGNPWAHVNNMVRSLMSGGLRRQQGQQQGQPGQVPGQGGFGQPHFDVPLSGPYAKPGQTMPTTSDPAVMPPVPYLGAGGLPGQAIGTPAPTPPTPMAVNGQVPSPQNAANWMMNSGANGQLPSTGDGLKSVMSGNFSPPSGQLPSTGDALKSIMSGNFSGLGNILGGFGNLFKGAGQDPGKSNQGGGSPSGGFA